MKAEVLRMIRSCENYVSGQEICEKLGVSRTAVWKVIKQLQEDGYDIEGVNNKGYCLVSYPEKITAPEIMSRVPTKWAGTRVYYRASTESTNEDAKELAADGKEHGSLVVADTQTAGKGRRGRVWQSPAGTTISFSIILRPELEPNKASMITLIMAIAVAEVISKFTELDAKIKWPNDIVVNKKKVCGILTEMDAEMDYIHDVIVGVGINVNNDDFPEEIRNMATSLKLEKGERVNRSDLIVGIMDFFEYYYEQFMEYGDLSAFVDLYDSFLINKDEQVKVLDPKGEYTGTAMGINDYGELIVQKEDGTIVRVSSGEVSVRGLYGYV